MIIFFFKQKTAYEMRISDWSSDVCSSDLAANPLGPEPGGDRQHHQRFRLPAPPAAPVAGRVQPGVIGDALVLDLLDRVPLPQRPPLGPIGRASCRERVGQDV